VALFQRDVDAVLSSECVSFVSCQNRFSGRVESRVVAYTAKCSCPLAPPALARAREPPVAVPPGVLWVVPRAFASAIVSGSKLSSSLAPLGDRRGATGGLPPSDASASSKGTRAIGGWTRPAPAPKLRDDMRSAIAGRKHAQVWRRRPREPLDCQPIAN
jgi:hypothetical protein